MRIEFEVLTNKDIPMINEALFKVCESGQTEFVDRDTTEWSVEKTDDGLYRMNMEWRDCYIWDGEEKHYLPDTERCDFLEFLEFCLEDDAGEDYFVDIVNYSVEPFVFPFGDSSLLITPCTVVTAKRLEFFDPMEDKCWDLVKGYAEYFGMQIAGNESFNIIKEIQEVILSAFKGAGITFEWFREG